jgi:hypothetical protein
MKAFMFVQKQKTAMPFFLPEKMEELRGWKNSSY